jgi:hypothetical protein
MAMAPLLSARTQGQCWTFARSSSTPSNPSRSEALHTQSPWSTSTGFTSSRSPRVQPPTAAPTPRPARARCTSPHGRAAARRDQLEPARSSARSAPDRCSSSRMAAPRAMVPSRHPVQESTGAAPQPPPQAAAGPMRPAVSAPTLARSTPHRAPACARRASERTRRAAPSPGPPRRTRPTCASSPRRPGRECARAPSKRPARAAPLQAGGEEGLAAAGPHGLRPATPAGDGEGGGDGGLWRWRRLGVAPGRSRERPRSVGINTNRNSR